VAAVAAVHTLVVLRLAAVRVALVAAAQEVHLLLALPELQTQAAAVAVVAILLEIAAVVLVVLVSLLFVTPIVIARLHPQQVLQPLR
jgi:hypothetical protein